MVTLKRNVKTESERYGGYSTGMSSSLSNFDRFRLTRENDIEEQSFDTKYYDDSQQYKDYLWKELNRTAPRRMLSPEEVKSGMKPEDLKEERYIYTPYSSRQQMAYAAPASHANAVSRDHREAQGITFKAKLMIVAYVAVVVFFLTLIVINAGTLSSLNQQIASLEATGSGSVSGDVVDGSLTETIPPVVEEHLAFGTGTEGNLQNAVYAGDYNTMSVSAPLKYETSGNWFDRICDWLGNVVGG